MDSTPHSDGMSALTICLIAFGIGGMLALFGCCVHKARQIAGEDKEINPVDPDDWRQKRDAKADFLNRIKGLEGVHPHVPRNNPGVLRKNVDEMDGGPSPASRSEKNIHFEKEGGNNVGESTFQWSRTATMLKDFVRDRALALQRKVAAANAKRGRRMFNMRHGTRLDPPQKKKKKLHGKVHKISPEHTAYALEDDALEDVTDQDFQNGNNGQLALENGDQQLALEMGLEGSSLWHLAQKNKEIDQELQNEAEILQKEILENQKADVLHRQHMQRQRSHSHPGFRQHQQFQVEDYSPGRRPQLGGVRQNAFYQNFGQNQGQQQQQQQQCQYDGTNHYAQKQQYEYSQQREHQKQQQRLRRYQKSAAQKADQGQVTIRRPVLPADGRYTEGHVEGHVNGYPSARGSHGGTSYRSQSSALHSARSHPGNLSSSRPPSTKPEQQQQALQAQDQLYERRVAMHIQGLQKGEISARSRRSMGNNNSGTATPVRRETTPRGTPRQAQAQAPGTTAAAPVGRWGAAGAAPQQLPPGLPSGRNSRKNSFPGAYAHGSAGKAGAGTPMVV